MKNNPNLMQIFHPFILIQSNSWGHVTISRNENENDWNFSFQV